MTRSNPGFYWFCFNCFMEYPDDYDYSFQSCERGVAIHVEDHQEAGEVPPVIVWGAVASGLVPHHSCDEYPLGWSFE